MKDKIDPVSVQAVLNTLEQQSPTGDSVAQSNEPTLPLTPIDREVKATQVNVQQNIDQINIHVPPALPPSTQTVLENSPPPIEVKVTVNHQSIAYKVGKWGWQLIDGCTLVHLRSNQPLYRNYLGTIKNDLVLLYRGHESIDSLDWLGHQNLPIRKTLQSIEHPDVMAQRIEGNFAKIRFVLLVMMVAFLGLLIGYIVDTYELIFVEQLSFLALLNNLYLMSTTLLFAYFYYAYAYHSFALSHDRFMLQSDFHKALKAFRRDAWFPFFKEF
ncbi:hypothetical protein [Vibrio sp. TRT 29B02]|uniref:hypothetical protein n=1 Tax=Vibrio sp. TRT 29B02 TaxID=3418508 RepID=UPI003CF94A3E